VGKEPHGEYLLPVIVDGGDESESVGDIESGDGAIAFNGHLVGMGKGLACLHEILPASGSRSSMPMVKWGTCFGMRSLCFFEKFLGDDAHASMA
jgi:hypothetical protein